jgi:DNA-binding IscR family transcriptional regulator
MKNKNILSQTILSQTNKFTVSQIISMTGVSNVYVSQTLQKLQAEGLIMRINKGKPQLWKVTSQEKVTTALDVATRFEYIRNLVDMVITNKQPSVMITGCAGIGKSYLVREQLKKADQVANEDYLQVSGHSSQFGLYKLLNDNRDGTICFDDCDSCFDDSTSVNILKAALDSYDTRWVSWYSSKAEQEELDPSFEFTGKIIFISNRRLDRIDPAVRSRAFCFDLQMSNDEISEHMQNILANIEPNVDINVKQEVLNFLKTIQDKFSNYNLRVLIQAIRIRNYCLNSDKNWQQMIQILTHDL